MAVALWSVLFKATDWTQIESLREVLKRGYQFFKLDLAMLSELAVPLIETLAMALGGTLTAMLAVLVLPKAASIMPGAATAAARPLVKLVLRLSGALHELLWGFLLVAVLGPSMAVGIAALALRSLQAIHDRLAPRAAAVAPQTHGRLSIALECFADNLGRGAVLGLAGVGGLGLHFYGRLASYQFGATAVTLLAVVTLIAAGQWLLHVGGVRPLSLWPGSNVIRAGTRPSEEAALARPWLGRIALLTIVGLILLSPRQTADIFAAIEIPTSFGASLVVLVQAAAESLRMNLVASVLGVAAALALGFIGSLAIKPLKPVLAALAAAAAWLPLAIPAVFLALLARSVLTVGPLGGTLAMAVAAAGLAARELLGTETGATRLKDPLETIVGIFGALLPLTIAIGLIGSGGIGWQLRLSLVAGEAWHVGLALVAIVLLIAASTGAAASARLAPTGFRGQANHAGPPAPSPREAV